MHAVVTTLLRQEIIESAQWESFWEDLRSGKAGRADATALLAALTMRLPQMPTLRHLLASLDAGRQQQQTRPWPGSVNVVGTGGGPSTFNISTAAAFTAAAMGVPVVKTGSRAYTSRFGSVDLLERLGVRLTSSLEQTAATLEQFGLAFAGPFVYPSELTLLARRIVPSSMRPFGPFLNALGPFLARVPVSAQVTGVSAGMPLPALQQLALEHPERRIWLTSNILGSDELFGFTENYVYPNDGSERVVLPRRGNGDLAGLEPVADPADLVTHFLSVLAGEAGQTALETVALNAAALAMAGGHADSWDSAVAQARATIQSGAVTRLAQRMRAASLPVGAANHG